MAARGLLVTIVLAVAVNAHAADSDAERWREDLAVLARDLPKHHKEPFHTVTQAEFDAAVAKLHQSIPDLPRNQIIVELARLVASIGDGHTRLGLPTFDANGYLGLGRDYLDADPKIGFRQYPLRLYVFDDGIHVIAASAGHESIVGGKVLEIGNAAADVALRAVSKIAFHDNEMSRTHRAAVAMTVPEVLNALGFIDDMDKGRFVVEKDGQRVTIELEPVDVEEVLTWTDARTQPGTASPRWLKDPVEPYWFEYLPESRTLYFQYNAVRQKQEEPLALFFDRLFKFAAEHPVERFVIDLRHNAGGNTALTWPLIYGLIRSDALNVRGKLFAIIGRSTFSAAVNTAVYLEKHTNAIFVGEPTGSRPNQHGDTLPVVLPNSGISVHTSFLYWQEAGPRDTRRWIAPRISAPLTSANYRSNIDPALQAALTFDSADDDLTALLIAAYERGGVEDAMQAYQAFMERPSSRYGDFELDVQRFGRALMERKQYTHALGFFRINAELHPDSRSAPVYMGLAARAAGDRKLAIESFRRAVELNPVNQFAVEALRELLAQRSP